MAPIARIFAGMRGRGQDRDAVTAVDEVLGDVQQRTDVAGRGQRGNEDFWHGSMLGDRRCHKLGGFVEIGWRSQVEGQSGSRQRHRGLVRHPVGPRVDVHRIAAQERHQGEPGLAGEVDGQ